MMQYSDKIQYEIYSTRLADFNIMVDMLLEQIPVQQTVLRLIFFGMPPTNRVYMKRYAILKAKVRARFKKRMPVLTYVGQPALDSGMAVEVHTYRKGPLDKVTYKETRGISYVLLENSSGRFLYAGGFQSDILNKSITEQSEEVFRMLGDVLQEEGFPVESIVRQWNYIERITGVEEGRQHYQAFNDARTAFYNQAAWTNGYPAATGIGVTHGGILVDIDAVLPADGECYVTPLDNRLQVAAHNYSESVLVTGQTEKSTPKFERGKCVNFGSSGVIYISGTAAIRGEESLKGAALPEQLYATMENIAYLISLENVTAAGATCRFQPSVEMLRIYLKDMSAVKEAKELMGAFRLSVPVVYLWADVCRDELLIEIEGIAKF